MQPIGILGVPMDLGSNRRGTDMGPSAIRYAGLETELQQLGRVTRDRGNVGFLVAETLQSDAAQTHFRDAIVHICQEVDREVTGLLAEGSLPLILGGDHSLSFGSVAAVARRYPDVGILWVDAHGDFNTPETSGSGNIHGMVLAGLVGMGDPALVEIGGAAPKTTPERVALVGARDVDPKERQALRRAGVSVFTMKAIDRDGIAMVMRQALEIVTGGGSRPLHLSLDLDSLDPAHAPGVGTPAKGGLTYREAHLAMELVADAQALISMEVVEVNPILDDQNKTGEMAVELIASALGKRIM